METIARAQPKHWPKRAEGAPHSLLAVQRDQPQTGPVCCALRKAPDTASGIRFSGVLL